MAGEGKHKFTREETIEGAKASAKSRKDLAKQSTKIIDKILNAQNAEAALNVIGIYAATPMGQLLISLGFLEIAHKTKLLTVIPAKDVAAVLVSETVISAIGQSNVIPQVGSLISAVGSTAGSLAKVGAATAGA